MSRPRYRSAFAPIGAVCLTGMLAACGSSDASTGEVSFGDLERFAAVHEQAASSPDCPTLSRYLEDGSDGLRRFGKITGSRDELCAAIHAAPARYAAVATGVGRFRDQEERVRGIYRAYAAALPDAVLPDLYVVVGRGWWGGTVRHGRIYVGAEVIEDAGGVPCLVAHELAHAQQRYRRLGTLTGGPAFLRGSLLAQSIKEGVADFVAELITGCVAAPERSRWAAQHEAELWREFSAVMHGKDYQPWIYGAGAAGRPPDLGYFFGYRIAQAYYANAEDKRAALTEMLSIRDFRRFHELSGYRGEPVADATAAGPEEP
jgi:hypothetical protein